MPGAPGLSPSPTTARPPSTSCATPAQPDSPPINITMGRQPIGGIRPPDYMRLDLAPKLYDLRAYGPQTNSELIITVAPGQTRFLLAQLDAHVAAPSCWNSRRSKAASSPARARGCGRRNSTTIDQIQMSFCAVRSPP